MRDDKHWEIGSDREAVPLFATEDERAERELRNGLKQIEEIELDFVRSDGRLKVTPELILKYHSLTLDGLWADCGRFRARPVAISNSAHVPPKASQIPALISDVCETANLLQEASFTVPAYLLWRINWIHPFREGNGRVARAICYLSLCVLFNEIFPGSVSMMEYVRVSGRYYAALESADAAWANSDQDGIPDLYHLEMLLSDALMSQIDSA